MFDPSLNSPAESPTCHPIAARSCNPQGYMDQLVTELERRGFRVAAKLPVLTVKNPALSGVDPKGQQVLITNYEDRGLTWCWIWPALRPALPGMPTPEPEVEPMCPAEDIEAAANRITNVVCLGVAELAVTVSDT